MPDGVTLCDYFSNYPDQSTIVRFEPCFESTNRSFMSSLFQPNVHSYMVFLTCLYVSVIFRVNRYLYFSWFFFKIIYNVSNNSWRKGLLHSSVMILLKSFLHYNYFLTGRNMTDVLKVSSFEADEINFYIILTICQRKWSEIQRNMDAIKKNLVNQSLAANGSIDLALTSRWFNRK